MFPAAEGYFASRNPGSVLLAGPVAFRAGVDGLAVARFGWANLDSGLVNNARASAAERLGFVFPSINGNTAVQIQCGVRHVRPGVGVTLMKAGDYWARFPWGARAGSVVYTLLIDGTPVSGEADGAEATQWFVATDAGPGCLAIISTTSKVTS